MTITVDGYCAMARHHGAHRIMLEQGSEGWTSTAGNKKNELIATVRGTTIEQSLAGLVDVLAGPRGRS